MSIKETFVFDGREIHLEWFTASDYPKDIKISQVAGFCVNEKKELLIIKNQRGWGFPGGHPEEGEGPETTLRREVAEEAYASVKEPKLIGYMDVNDPKNESIEGKHSIQLRYLAEIEAIGDFKKEFETSERALVSLENLPKYISWLSGSTGSAQYKTLIDNLK